MTRPFFVAGLAIGAFLLASDAGGAANPEPLAPGADDPGFQILFRWTTDEPSSVLDYDLHLEPSGNLLADGTAAPLLADPLDLSPTCAPCGLPDPDQCIGIEGSCFCTTTGVCSMFVDGYYAGATSRPELFTADGDEYCWKIRESGTAEYSPELCFVNVPEGEPDLTFPLWPLEGPSGEPAYLPAGPVSFQWDRGQGAFADHVRVYTSLGPSPDLLCEAALSSAAPGAVCDELLPGRLYYWDVRGFNGFDGFCATQPFPQSTRCYGLVPPNQSPNAFVLRECIAGDCDGDLEVSIAELIQAVRISLGQRPVSSCPAADPDGNGEVGISNLIAAVNANLSGCTP